LKTITPIATLDADDIRSVFHGSVSTTQHHQRTKRPAETNPMQIFGSYKTQVNHTVVMYAQITPAAPLSTAHFS
jgi:hypothetical protein